MKKYVTLTVLILVFSMLAVVVLADTDSMTAGSNTLTLTTTPRNSSSGCSVNANVSVSCGSSSSMYSKGAGVVIQGYGYYLPAGNSVPMDGYYGSSYKKLGDLTAGSSYGHNGSFSISNPSGSTLLQAGAKATYYYNCSSSAYPSSNSAGYAFAIDYVN